MAAEERVTLPQLIEWVEAKTKQDDVLGRVAEAVSLSEELGALSEELTFHFVHEAKAAGYSWAQIGAQLGVSKQGAQQRFVVAAEGDDSLESWLKHSQHRHEGEPGWQRGRRRGRGGLPFQRFTGSARHMVVSAREEAQKLGHGFVGTEHLLLAILSYPDEIAGRALAALGVTEESARPKILAEIGVGMATGPGRLPFSRDAKKSLELGLREAIRMGHHYLGTEHILLGLVRGESRATELLSGLGVQKGQVEAEVNKLMPKP